MKRITLLVKILADDKCDPRFAKDIINDTLEEVYDCYTIQTLAFEDVQPRENEKEN